MKLFITFALATAGISGWALPFLQLDVVGPHHYDGSSQTTIADSNPFYVRALIDANSAAELARTHYISAAIVPNSGPGFGSFTFAGNTYSSGNMSYGIPPVDAAIQDIASHGVFPTFYTEIAFSINLANQVPAYNTQSGGLDAGNFLYYVDFLCNVGSLAPANSVHFDLYTYDGNPDPKKLKVDAFAPFSHDAESGTHGIIIGSPVPEGGTTILLLGSALTGLGLLRRKVRRFTQ